MLKQVIILWLSFFFFFNAEGQLTDSMRPVGDSTHIISAPRIKNQVSYFDTLLRTNFFLNSSAPPAFRVQSARKFNSKDIIFYVLCLLLLLLGILKGSYSRYYSNLIRVFFNTSLRQGQLTDQLMQAKQPSLFFNLFFVLISGWYVYLLLSHFHNLPYNQWHILLMCIAGIFIIYITKFCVIKFTGWLTGYQQEAETYIFIVFLINKIISVCLIPIVIIIPFSTASLVYITIIISYILIALMLLMRFFRSYGLLQRKLKVSGFHFFLYVIGIELLPLFLIYKGALVIMSKYL